MQFNFATIYALGEKKSERDTSPKFNSGVL